MIETYVALLKLGRTPAMNRLPDVLLGADHDGKDDEDDGGVEVVQAVDPVIVVTAFETRICRKTPQHAVKPAWREEKNRRSRLEL